MGMVRKCFGNVPLKDVKMERVRVEKFEESLYVKIVDESILFFSRVSLLIFSLEALYISWVYGGIYTGVRKECEESFFHNRVDW